MSKLPHLLGCLQTFEYEAALKDIQTDERQREWRILLEEHKS